MTCQQVREQIVAAVCEHVAIAEHCSRCAACERLRRNRAALNEAVAQLRMQTNSLVPSLHVRNAVLAQMASPMFRAQSQPWTQRWIAASLSAAVLILAIVCSVARHDHTMSPAPPHETAGDQFIAMPYVVPPAPYERTTIIRAEVPMQIMVAAGFKVYGDTMETTTPADVLYGEDGRILAIRLISQPGS